MFYCLHAVILLTVYETVTVFDVSSGIDVNVILAKYGRDCAVAALRKTSCKIGLDTSSMTLSPQYCLDVLVVTMNNNAMIKIISADDDYKVRHISSINVKSLSYLEQKLRVQKVKVYILFSFESK